MHKGIRINDTVNLQNQNVCGLKGIVQIGKGKKQVPYNTPHGIAYRTELEELYSEEENIIPLGGNSFFFHKMLNIAFDNNTTTPIGHLNDHAPMMGIGVPRDHYIGPRINAEFDLQNPDNFLPGVNISANHAMFGFMVGDGGALEDGIKPRSTIYNNRTLFRAIPFRVSTEPQEIDRNKYYGKSVLRVSDAENIDSFFIKKFDDPAPRIVHMYRSDNPNEYGPVDTTVFNSTTSIPIESYAEINMSLSNLDIREFNKTQNSTMMVNEIGIVAGWYNREWNDYESLVLITHYTRESIIIAGDDEVDILYKIFAK